MVNRRIEAVVTADIRQFQRSMNLVGVSANNAAAAAIGAFTAVIGTVTAMSKATLDAASSFETLRTRLQLLNGDMRRGAEEFDMIRERAKFSIFETDKLIESYIRLKALAGDRFATENLENIGFAARVAGENMETMARRVGELVIRLESGLTPGLAKRSLRTFATAFGRPAVKELIALVDAGASAEEIILRLEQALSRFGKTAEEAIAKTVAGQQAKLGGIFTDLLASAGEGEALQNYRKTLESLSESLLKLQGSESFNKLAGSITDLSKALLDLVSHEGFDKFISDMVDNLRLAVEFVTALVRSLEMMLTLRESIVGPVQTPTAVGLSNQFALGNVGRATDVVTDFLSTLPVTNPFSAGKALKVIVTDGDGENVYAQ